MSLLLSWRRFPFFDREQVKDPEKPDEPFLGLQELDCVGSCSGGGVVIFGESNGGICQVTRNMSMSYWRAHSHRLLRLDFVSQHNLLITVGEDEEGGPAYLKAWQLGRIEKGVPFCSRVSRIPTPGGKSVQIRSIAVHGSLQWLAIGFEDSAVLLYRGDLTREKSLSLPLPSILPHHTLSQPPTLGHCRTSGKPQFVREGVAVAPDGAVLGLSFRQLPDKRMVLFVLTTRLVLSLVFRDKELERKTILDSKGATERCWTSTDAGLDHQLVLARREMVFFYHPLAAVNPEEGVEPKCYGFEGDKILAASAGPYLAIVTRDVSNMEASNMNLVTLYDIAEQYIAFSAPMPEVSEVFYSWGAFFVLCKSGKLFRLQEKETQERLHILFRKNLFDLATNLAKRDLCDAESLAAIFKQHGDYLYQDARYRKGDYDNAAREYIHTIGSLEPSYVIRKFLDTQRIAQLTQYLEAVHRAGLGISEHTTILLNCYTKLGDASKIAQFLKASAADMPFDLDTAIKVLSGAGYLSEALQLAKEHGKSELALHILLQRQSDAPAALAYLQSLPKQKAGELMKEFGKPLVALAPEKTLALLKDLCFGEGGAQPAEFLNVFLDHSKELEDFLESMDSLIIGDSGRASEAGNTLLALYLRDWTGNGKTPQQERKILQFLSDPGSAYQDEQALVLCQTAEFAPGTLFLYEKMKLYSQVLNHHMRENNFEAVIETCKRFGSEEELKEMWIEALWFLARSDDPQAVQWVGECLKYLHSLKLLPPLMVLEILSHSQAVTLGLVKDSHVFTVKDYLLGWLREENERIEEDEASIASQQAEISELEAAVFELENRPQTFQVSKCSACGSGLEVPAVHFLCRHSYHLSCFEGYAESESECPMCLPANKKLRAQLSAQEEGSKETFAKLRSELSGGGDAMRSIAEAFGRGVYGASAKNTKAPASKATLPQTKPRTPSLNPFDDED